MKREETPPTSARHWAAQRLAIVAEQFPQLDPPDNDLEGLSPADAALALAIYRTTVQRWFTLQCIIEKFLSKQLRRLEPPMQAVLMSGAAQLVFFDRLPAYAVVDESVELARTLVRQNAAGMVNAVLRQVDRLMKDAERVRAWSPNPAMLPLPGGGAIKLRQDVLPPAAPPDKHLVEATSMPLRLTREWLQRWGDARTTELCLQAIENPPTTIVVEAGFDAAAHKQVCVPHAHRGFVVWTGPSEGMGKFLSGHPDRRVQDVASSLAVESTRDLKPQSILDFCAGMGTKTRQLALMHPQARVTATDTHPGRRQSLIAATASLPNVTVVEPDQAASAQYDLVLLDVPCSNTGVLARRPEARYRFSQQTLGELVTLQREILEKASGWVSPGGHMLYSTCSIEPPENHKTVERLTRKSGTLVHEHQQFPQGSAATYTDGSYHALVKV